MSTFEMDREKSPLRKDLHELGLKHGVRMIVVALPMNEGTTEKPHALLIDHKDDTTREDAVHAYLEGAGLLFTAAALAAE